MILVCPYSDSHFMCKKSIFDSCANCGRKGRKLPVSEFNTIKKPGTPYCPFKREQ
jgi:hypothetical protein